MKIIHRTPEEAWKHWIAKLRSGEYLQAKNRLTNRVGFCCLGVVCDLASKDGGPRWETHADGLLFLNFARILPQKIRHYLELTDTEEYDLSAKNDSGWKFDEIADFMEQKLMPRCLARLNK